MADPTKTTPSGTSGLPGCLGVSLGPIDRAIWAFIGIIKTYATIWTTKGVSVLVQGAKNLVQALLEATTALIPILGRDLKKAVDAVLSGVNTYGPPIREGLKPAFEGIAREAFTAVSGSLMARGHIPPEKWTANAADAMADAFGFGLSSFGVTAAFEALTPEKLNTLNGVGPMLSELAGFDEVAKAALGPLFDAAIARPATYDMNNKMRPNLPAAQLVGMLYSRRLIDHKTAKQLMAYAGYQDAHIDKMLDGAFRPTSPFVLSRLADGPDWDPNPMRELLRFAGYRDRDIDLLIKAFEAQALRSLRQQYLTAAMASYEAGFSSDSDLQAVLDNLKFNAAAQDLIKKIAGLKKSDKVFKDHVEAETNAAKNDVIPVEQMRINLGKLGLDLAVLDGLTDQVNSHNAATEASAQRREVETLIRHERQLYIQDWLLALQKGDVNEVEFTAGMLAIGLPVPVVAEYLVLGELRKKPPKKPPATKPPAGGGGGA